MACIFVLISVAKRIAVSTTLLIIVTAAVHANGRTRHNPDHKIVRSGSAMGTVVHVTFWADNDRAAAEAFAALITEFERIEALMTSWTDNSTIARINRHAGNTPISVDPETFFVAQKAQAIAQLTAGAFDMSVGVFHNLWRFGSHAQNKIPDAATVSERIAHVDYQGIKLRKRNRSIALAQPGMRITFGGIAKGYAVDRAVALLHERGLSDFILQFGGDLYVSGNKDGTLWRVGIRDPRGSRATPFAVAAIQDKTFSTSGDYERSFISAGTRYHHILDPATGRPARKSRSVTVMADDAMTADALSTALFVMGQKRGMPLVESLTGVDAVFVDAHNQVHISSDLQGKLTILKQPTPGI